MLGLRKNVPMPTSAKAHEQFPLADMEVGDSFIVPSRFGPRQKVSGCIQGWRLISGSQARFKTAWVDDGVGVWRIE